MKRNYQIRAVTRTPIATGRLVLVRTAKYLCGGYQPIPGPTELYSVDSDGLETFLGYVVDGADSSASWGG